MTTSSAIVFHNKDEVQLTSIELPSPRDDEVLIDNHITAVSIGTERWALSGQRPEIKFPNIPGYLGVGVITQRGPRVKHLSVGQRIFYTTPRWLSPHGSNSWMGTHAASVVVPVKDSNTLPFYFPVPQKEDGISAALAGLAAVPVQGADMARIDSTQTVLVLGLGLIGQSAAQIYQARGARVVVADLVADKVDRAKTHGRLEGVTLEKSAIASAKMRCRTVLIEYHPVLGGMGTAALVNNFCPAHCDGKRQIIGGIFGELRQRLIDRGALYVTKSAEPYDPESFCDEVTRMCHESGIEILLSHQIA